MNGPSGERVTEWAGGSLSELMSALLEAALPARIRVFAPGARGEPAGEVHLLAGGLADAFAGADRGQEAVAVLQRVTGARFVIDTPRPGLWRSLALPRGIWPSVRWPSSCATASSTC